MKSAFIAVLIFLISAAGYELYGRHHAAFMLEEGLDIQAQKMLANNRPAEAQILANFVLSHPETGDPQGAKAIANESAFQLNSAKRKLRQFTKGAWSGEPDDTASFLGSLSLDLFVVGDIRDLVVQGWKQWRDDSGDEIVMALSAAGLATSLAPEIHWAPSMMKAFKRTGALSRPFIATLKTTGKQALKTRKFDALADIAGDFGMAGRKLGPGPFSSVMKNIDNATDLKKISKAARLDPNATYVIGARFGNKGVKQISKNGSNIGALAKKIRVLTRAAKISKKAFSALPDWVLVIIIAAAVGLLLRLTRPCQSKRFRKAITRFAATPGESV